MSRRAVPWVACASCCALVLAAMLWLTVTALRVDRAERDARALAAAEESVRLALWRMELVLAPLLTQENAQPYFVYGAFYPAERAYGRMFAGFAAGELLVPSPFLAGATPHVRLHFQIDPGGALHSPEAPEGALRALAERQGLVTGEELDARAALLAELGPHLGRAALAGIPGIEQPQQRDLVQAAAPPPDGPQRTQTAEAQFAQPPAQGRTSPQQEQMLVQQRKSTIEFQARNEAQRQAFASNTIVQQEAAPFFSAKGGIPSQVLHGPMTALWSGAHLVLARRVTVGGGEYLQGCVLDWPSLRQFLLAAVRDILPGPDIEPYPHAAARSPERLLAGIPARLLPGALPEEPAPFFSPIRVALLVAWPCLLLAAGALLSLLAGAIRLSERRGAFVSSVTHELRTPLTTFRMYAEMLAEGMVPSEEQRTQYLRTLCTEADRLSHLVENVLAYSRIERRRAVFAHETLTAGDLLLRTRERLVERADRAGMQLVVESPDAASAAVVRTCPSAVEQILFNLVDNACKYAAGAGDARIHVTAEAARGGAAIAVADHGPGIEAGRLRALFAPFAKSARQAADSAPGVGLGLALCRRLAREIGASLAYDPRPPGGARFVLRLKG